MIGQSSVSRTRAQQLLDDIRRRRDADDRYAEMLLVADKTMHEAHGDDLRNFLLAVANVVSSCRR